MAFPAAVPFESSSGRRLGILGLLAALLVLAVVASLAVGTRPLTPAQVWQGLTGPAGTREAVIVWSLRMPRTGLGLVAGAGFALAGALMQAVTRNPLAEPGLLGVNAGASLAVVSLLSLTGGAAFGATVAAALAGAVLAAIVVHGLGTLGGRPDPVRLLLAGAALSASLGAVTAIVTMVDTEVFDSFRFWIVGSIAGRPAEVVLAAAPLVAAGALAALALGPSLNALSMGDDVARGLGLGLGRVRAASAVSITLLAGTAVAAAGPIGFAGLVTPHAARLVLGEDWRWVMPACLLAGPALVLAADVAGRVIAAPGEIEVGVMLAFLGAPVLLHLVLAQRR